MSIGGGRSQVQLLVCLAVKSSRKHVLTVLSKIVVLSLPRYIVFTHNFFGFALAQIMYHSCERLSLTVALFTLARRGTVYEQVK